MTAWMHVCGLHNVAMGFIILPSIFMCIENEKVKVDSILGKKRTGWKSTLKTLNMHYLISTHKSENKVCIIIETLPGLFPYNQI